VRLVEGQKQRRPPPSSASGAAGAREGAGTPDANGVAARLKEVDLLETFARFPAGKRNHVLLWIEETARLQTSKRRIAMTIEVTFRASEGGNERSAGKGTIKGRTSR
jgi:hypothetical protein